MISLEGKRTIGNSAVTAIGTTSLIHQMAIHTITPSNRNPLTLFPVGVSNRKLTKKQMGPNRVKKYVVFLLII